MQIEYSNKEQEENKKISMDATLSKTITRSFDNTIAGANKIPFVQKNIEAVQEDAKIALSKANLIKRNSKYFIDEAKQKYVDMYYSIKNAHENYFERIFDVDNNKSIIFTSVKSDLSNPDAMEEFDLNGKLLRKTFFDETLRPKMILEYSSNDKYTKYSYDRKNDTITISFDVRIINRTNYSIEKRYTYKNNQLVKYEENINASKVVSNIFETYKYNDKSNTIAYLKNAKFSEKENICQEQFVFANNELVSFS